MSKGLDDLLPPDQRVHPDIRLLEFPKQSLQDVPTILRNLANNIESGDYGVPDIAVVVLIDANGKPELFGAGNADPIRTIGALHIGAAWMATHTMVRE